MPPIHPFNRTAREFGEAEKRKNREVAEGNEVMGQRNEVANLERGQQPNFFPKKGTERDHLKEYVADLDKRIALIAPHCGLKKLNMSR